MINRLDVPFISSSQETAKPKTAKNPKGKEENFLEVLEEARGHSLNFSAHARRRLQARQINLDATEINKLARAVEKVADKGSRSSLLLYKDLAFVAGVQSRTIITALDGESRKEHIFTNIDSAVIVE